MLPKLQLLLPKLRYLRRNEHFADLVTPNSMLDVPMPMLGF